MCDDNLLHRARLQRGIELDEVAAQTCLPPHIVQHIDEGRFDALPAGLYARSYVRAFASVVGVEPEQAVRRLEACLPGIGDPLPALRDKARGAAPDWAEVLDEWSRETVVRLKTLATRAIAWADGRSRLVTTEVAAFNPGDSFQSLAPLRLPRLPERRLRPSAAQPLRTRWRSSRLSALRCVAACFDAAVLLVLLALIVRLTAWTSGAGVDAVLAAAGEAIAALWGVLVLLYFVMLGGVGGRTPGAAVCGLPASIADEPLCLRSILARAMLH